MPRTATKRKTRLDCAELMAQRNYDPVVALIDYRDELQADKAKVEHDLYDLHCYVSPGGFVYKFGRDGTENDAKAYVALARIDALRARIADVDLKLAQYAHPKLAAVDVSGSAGAPTWAELVAAEAGGG